MTDFNSRSAAHGLHYGEFAHLTERDRRKLSRLMARVAEKAYRRGAQHGAQMALDGTLARDLARVRFESNLDRSPWLDDPGQWDHAEDRLHMENAELRQVGLHPRRR
jgi:hypothetical protein